MATYFRTCLMAIAMITAPFICYPRNGSAEEGLGAPIPTTRTTKDFTQDDIVSFRRNYEYSVAMLGTLINGNPPRTMEEAVTERRKGRDFALRVLGQTGAVESRRDIVRNLAYHSQYYGSNEGRYSLTDWPAADALVQLGSHAYPAVYGRLRDPCSELDFALLAQIVLNIDGRELGLCRLKIEQKKPNANDDPFYAKHLARLIAILEDKDAAPGKYSPNVIFRAAETNPALLQTDETDEDD